MQEHVLEKRISRGRTAAAEAVWLAAVLIGLKPPLGLTTTERTLQHMWRQLSVGNGGSLRASPFGTFATIYSAEEDEESLRRCYESGSTAAVLGVTDGPTVIILMLIDLLESCVHF